MHPPGTINYPVFKPFTLSFMRAHPVPPGDRILGPWLTESSLTLIHGPRGIGKTRLALAIAHAVASGSSLLGWEVPRPRRVLHIDGEMRIGELQEACATLPPPATDDHLRYLVMDVERDDLDLTQPSHRFRLAEHLDGADLIILDNLATLAAGGGENAVETWQPIESWARVQSRAGRALILIHHSGRLGHQRGTTRREDRMDTILALRPCGEAGQGRGASFDLHLEKHRGRLPPGAFPLRAHLAPDGWHASQLCQDPATKVATLTREGLSVRAIAGQVGLSPATVNRLQHTMRHTEQPEGVSPVSPVSAVSTPVSEGMRHPPHPTKLATTAPGATTPASAKGRPAMLVDTHCHLDYFKPEELPAIIARAAEMGVGELVTIGTTLAQSERIRAIAEAWPNVWCTAGIHPHHSGEGEVPAPEAIAALTDHPKVIGIGEAGLDYFYDRAPRERQQDVFRAHIRAARLAGVPLAIHTRDADVDTMKILQEEKDNGGDFMFLLHCFSSSRQLAEFAVNIGGYVSFSGILTFPKSEEFRSIARDLPADRLLVETDSPYLAPVPNRGKRNEPAWTAHTAKVLAETRNLPIAALAELTTANFHRLFRKAA